MTPEDRAQQTLRMEKVEAERDLVEGIRAGVAAAAKVTERGWRRLNARRGASRKGERRLVLTDEYLRLTP